VNVAGTPPATREAALFAVQVGAGWHMARPGGLERVFLELTRRLPALGIGTQGLVVGNAQVAQQSAGAVRAFAPEGASMLTRLRAVRRTARAALAEHPGALLVSHFAPYGLGLLGLPAHRFVVHFHGPWSAESRAEGHGALSFAMRRTLERAVYRRADACVVLSRAFSALLQREFGVRADRIHVIPGGVSTERFASLPDRAAARAALGWPADRPIVLAVRRLVRRTGVDRLVEAMPALRARVPNVLVLIAGEGPETAALDARIRAHGVGDAVRLLGRLPEEQLPLAYRAATLTVVPTVALEGFGLIVPESLAAGTPVMVTPVGGLPETVEDLSPAMILQDATPGAIATGLAEALTGARQLPDAAACAAFACERYDWSVVARQVATLYTSLA